MSGQRAELAQPPEREYVPGERCRLSRDPPHGGAELGGRDTAAAWFRIADHGGQRLGAQRLVNATAAFRLTSSTVSHRRAGIPANGMIGL